MLSVSCVSAWPAGETTWDKNAKWLQERIQACQQRAEEFACGHFAARALNQLFGFTEFCKGDNCLMPYEIAAEIHKDQHWTALGQADDQKTLTQAQEMATGGLPVIAVQASSDKGSVAIIMPGALFPSGNWDRKVPLAVGVRLDKPEGSVYRSGLSYLFSEPAKVTLYAYK
jgi:hypothetical protein